jgi:DNA-binding transcriptional LysR family regulator
MELNHLRYFKEVAESENISQASKKLYVSQPALSVSIKKLETELDCALFVRQGNKIKLTEAGQCYLSYVNQVFLLLDEGAERTRDLANRTKQALRVASGFGVVSDMVDDYSEEHPGVSIDLNCYTTKKILERLNDGRADVGIVQGRVRDTRLENRVIMTGHYYVCVNKEHPFADRTSIRLTELENEKLFCSNIAETQENVTRILQGAGVNCKLFELDEKEILFSAAVKGLGSVFCMPMLEVNRKQTGNRIDNVTFVPIEDCPAVGQIVMVWRKDGYFTEEQEQCLEYLAACFHQNEQSMIQDLLERGVKLHVSLQEKI